ncbi:MAG TPA: cytochrome c [Caulobacteraceae bacterium]|nr:cytochrome c [Caulobacteraceae bacterium]
MRVWRAIALAALGLLAACDLSMRKQRRYDTLASAELWADGAAARHAPDDTVAQDQPTSAQPPVTAALLARGRERYAIYCIPCHGETGRGDGAIVQRGFPPPPDLARADLRQASAQQLYDAISNGYGLMYPFSDRVAPADRWAIVAYLRALQLARNGDANPGAGA